MIKEIPLEKGKRIYFQKSFKDARTARKIFLENSDGSVDQVVYGDNQKRYPVVIRRVSSAI